MSLTILYRLHRELRQATRGGRAVSAAVSFCALGLVGLVSCSPQAPETPQKPQATPEVKPLFTEKALPEQKGKKKLPGLPAYNQKGPAVPLVGGCGDLCGSARAGFEGFIRSLLLEKAPSDLPFIRFVDSSILVDNKQALGTQWAQLFIENKLPERQGSIDAWIERYKARVGHVADPEALEAVLDSGAELSRISSTQVRFTFAPPPREGSQTAQVWSIVVSRRGLEWLVSDIADAP